MQRIPFYPKQLFSHLLILLIVIISFVGFFQPLFKAEFGMNRFFFDNADYLHVLLQTILFQFFHMDVLHLLMNGYFLYILGPAVESRMPPLSYRFLFAFTTIFVAVALLIFSSNSNTIGISGFCMAIMAYLFLDLSKQKSPMMAQIGFFLVLNILLGFTGNISFVGHFFGAIAGAIWWGFQHRK